MRIAQLLSAIPIFFSVEERKFYENNDEVSISALTEHDQWIAQNLVRKGAYTISKDNNTLVKIPR